MAKGNAALHEDLKREHAVKGSSNRTFGIVFAVVFVIVGALPAVSGEGVRLWAFPIAGVFLAIALAAPSLLAPFNRVWTRFGLLLSKISTPIVMGVLFFAVLTPIGFLMRLSGKDPLRLKFDRAGESYWINREPPGPEPESMKNMY